MSVVTLSATEVSVLCELAEGHEMNPTRSLSEFMVQELKEKLRALGLNTTGSKSDLINRLMEADPAGGWLCVSSDPQNGPCNREQSSECEMPAMNVRVMEVSRQEMEVMKKEKEFLERELAIARREIESLREERLCEAVERDAVTEVEAGQARVRRVTDSAVTTRV